jgi:16S rRNA (uracil1498-N3)-methyltransferase
MRLGEGSEILVADGKGAIYKACIERADPNNCRIAIIDRTDLPRHWMHDLHLAIAPTKNADRMEWLCEKAAEVGINRISLLRCAHSERRELRTDRLEKILVSAMKQSGQAYLPALEPIADFADFIRRPHPAQRFIAHCAPGSKAPLQSICRPADALILIGPEGDFSPSEIALATEEGFAPISLGPSRLRTETAGLVACIIWHNAQG